MEYAGWLLKTFENRPFGNYSISITTTKSNIIIVS